MSARVYRSPTNFHNIIDRIYDPLFQRIYFFSYAQSGPILEGSSMSDLNIRVEHKIYMFSDLTSNNGGQFGSSFVIFEVWELFRGAEGFYAKAPRGNTNVC